jgi:hypothetical protein
MGKRRRQIILHSPPHSDPYEPPHPTPTLRPGDPRRLAFSFLLHCQIFPQFLLLLPVSLLGES